MNASSIIVVLIAIVAAAILYSQNPDLRTISFFLWEIRASTGVLCVSALGLGVVTGVLAMLTRDVPRMLQLRGQGGGDEGGE